MQQTVAIHGAQKYAIDEKTFLVDTDGKQKDYSVKQQFLQTFGCARKVYNILLDAYYAELERKGYEKGTPPTVKLPEVSTFKNAYPYLKDVDSLALANAKIHVSAAIGKFADSKTQSTYRKGAVLRAQTDPSRPLTPKDLKGMPVFKSKKHGDFSYTTNNQLAENNPKLKNDTIRLQGNRLHLPKIKKDVILVLHRGLPDGAVIKNVTVSMDAQGKFFASIGFMYEIPMELDLRTAAVNSDTSNLGRLTFLGLDYDQKSLYVDSEGNEADYPYFYKRSQEKLAKLQRELSRMVEASKNYERQRVKIAKLSRHIADQRKDFLHKRSAELVKRYDVICVEDIDLRSMGSALSLGKNLHDGGFGMFRTMLSYKLQRKGSCLVKIDRWYPSSKTCSQCGHIYKELQLGEDTWECPVCHTVHHRDRNAAINIREEGKRIFPDYFAEVIEKENSDRQRTEKLHNARANKKKTAA